MLKDDKNRMDVARRPVRVMCKAFTLIELLVVISIISLLVAILLPALASARGSARSIKCASNLKQHALSVLAYAADFHGIMSPDISTRVSPYLVPVTGATAFAPVSYGSLYPMFLGYSVNSPNVPGGWIPKTGSIFQCPEQQWLTTPSFNPFSSYGPNSRLGGGNAGVMLNLDNIPHASNTMIWMEGGGADTANVIPWSVVNTLLDWTAEDPLIYRHPGSSINEGFVDGHVRTDKYMIPNYTYGRGPGGVIYWPDRTTWDQFWDGK